MGKVQDTIKRIARRQKPAAHNVALIIPTQKNPGPQSFPVEYSAVAEWLADQASSDYQTQLIGLTRAIRHSNRLSNSATERLKITTLFQTQIDVTTPALKTLFVDTELPFSAEAKQAFEHYTTLLRELAYGYKIALVDALLRRSGLHRLDRIHAIYFAMRYLGELGFRYSQSYMPWPEKCWRDINTLYLLAEKESALDDTIKQASEGHDSFPQTIGQLYSALSMFHLSNCDRLSAVDMETLLSQLSTYAGLVTTTTREPFKQSSLLFSVAINSTGCPSQHQYCNYQPEDQIRFLDLTPVAERLQQKQHAAAAGEDLTRLQWQKIIQIWTRSRQRQSARTISSGSVSIHTGVKDCHALLQTGANDNHTGKPNFTLVNRSEHGMNLRGGATVDNRIRAGELISCIQAGNSPHIDTGVVRWINVLQHDDLQIGVEFLGEQATAVVCERTSQDKLSWEPKLEALMIDINNRGSMTKALIFSGKHYRLGDCINVSSAYDCDQTVLYKLAESIDFSSNFESYRVTEIHIDQRAEIPSI